MLAIAVFNSLNKVAGLLLALDLLHQSSVLIINYY